MGLEAVRDFLGALILAQIIIAPLDPAESRVSEDFPPGKGRQLVVDTCTACHSAKLVLQNRMTRDNWDETITWMQKKQGLWELTKEERSSILDYLSSVLGVEAGKQGRETEQGISKGPEEFKIYRYDYKPNPL